MSKSKNRKKTANMFGAAVSNNPLVMARQDNPYTKLIKQETKETKENDTIDKNNILGSMTQETQETKQTKQETKQEKQY